MARSREFDEEVVLNAAMQAFWRTGYEHTSLGDLLWATGLSKSSLYASFGDKRSLFLAAFERYRRERKRKLDGYLASEPTAYASIAAFFRMVAAQSFAGERPFGCMSCNEAISSAPHDPEIQAIVARDMQGIEDALFDAIKRGLTDGSIMPVHAPRLLARSLAITHHGLQMMIRSGMAFEHLDDAVTVALSLLRKAA